MAVDTARSIRLAPNIGFQALFMVVLVLVQFLRSKIDLAGGMGWASWYLEGYVGAPPPDQIALAHAALNSVCALSAWYVFRQIVACLALAPAAELVAFSVCFATYPWLADYPYHPVTLDSLAFVLGLAGFLFYLRRQTVLLMSATLLCGWVWPEGFVSGLLLVAFPKGTRLRLPGNTDRWVLGAGVASALLVGGLLWKWALQVPPEASGAAMINRALLPLSAVTVALYLLWVLHAWRTSTTSNPERRSQFSYVHIALALGVLVLEETLYHRFPLRGGLENVGVGWISGVGSSLMNPGHFIAAHFIYFGPVIVLVLFCAKDLVRFALEEGVGLTACLALAMVSLINSESRCLEWHLPFWFIVSLKYCGGKLGWKAALALVSLQLLFSHFWLPLDIRWDANQDLLQWPQQFYLMHYGPWMNVQAYGAGLAGIVVSLGVFWSLRRAGMLTPAGPFASADAFFAIPAPSAAASPEPPRRRTLVDEVMHLDLSRKQKLDPDRFAHLGQRSGGKAAPEKGDAFLEGVTIENITSERRDEFGLDENVQGVLVTAVEDDSPAAQMGLQEGDVIVQVNRQNVKSTAEARSSRGDDDGAPVVLKILVREQPGSASANAPPSRESDSAKVNAYAVQQTKPSKKEKRTKRKNKKQRH